MLLNAIYRGGGLLGIQHYRIFCTHVLPSSVKVDKKVLQKLRKKTRYPINKCKDALEKYENDFGQAEKWMKEQALKEGWEKASRLGNRPMSQGLIALVKQKNMAAMVELNCESDFVARNEQFRKLVKKLTFSCLDHGKESDTNKLAWGKEAVNELEHEDSLRLNDVVAREIGLLDENMALRRATFMKGDTNQIVGSFVHTTGPPLTDDTSCEMGKYGAIVLISHLDSSTPENLSHMKLVGEKLAQHVVGFSPESIGIEDMKKDKENKKVIKRKRIKDDETRMLYQTFVLDDEITIQEYLEEENVQIHDFIRFECGEVLDED